MSAAPQLFRFLTTLALVSTASLAASNNAGQEVNQKGALSGESRWQSKELKSLLKSDVAKLKNQIKLERMFALASGSSSISDKNADESKDKNKDKKKNHAPKAERLRAEVEGAISSTPTPSPAPRSQPPKQDKDDPTMSVVDDLVGFDLPPDSMGRAAGMARTTMSPVDGSGVEMQPPYAQGTRSFANTGYHMYEAALPPPHEPANEQVEVASRYANQPHNEYLPLSSAAQTAARGGSHIRVVFNNNPQFIIGRSGHDGLPVSVHGSGGSHGRLSPAADDYNPAESSLDETKVTLGGLKNDHQLPCAKDTAHRHVGHMEMINLKGPSSDVDEQKNVASVPELHTVRQPMSAPPPLPSSTPQASPPILASSRPLDLVSALNRPSRPQPDDEQVNVPLEEVAKSNFRPPLRMVVSMRNKDGDLMKLPINLQGSKGSPSFFDLGPKMRIHFEPQVQTHSNSVSASFTGGPLDKLSFVDENTPLGGDVFDPANVKPFAKIRPRSKEEPPQMQEKLVSNKPIIPPTSQIQVAAPREMPLRNQVTSLAKPPQPADLRPIPQPEPITQNKVAQTEPFPVQQSDDKLRDCDKNEGPLEGPIFMPPTNLFQNKTLANMFVEFQKALTEQMQIQTQIPLSQPPSQQMALNGDSPTPQQNPILSQMKQEGFNSFSGLGHKPMGPQETDRALRAMRFHEQQEDLVVAMMAANASNPASIEPGKQMSMTVITPPRGTSLEDAIRMHVGDIEDRTVAILHSSNRDPPTGGGSVFQSAANGGPLQPVEEHSRTFPVDVQLRKPGLASVESGGGGRPQSGPPTLDGPQDSDGFASATNLNHHQQRRWPYDLEQQYYQHQQPHNNQHHYHRYKRSAALEFAGTLEPSDRISVAAAALGKTHQSGSTGIQTGIKDDLREDPVVGAASEEHQNESESDVDSAADSSEEEPSSGASDSDMEARSDSDLDGDSSESDLDDTPDESSEFDSDDEPYNQVASSERDYNTPAFEIPQIDLSPQSLKQKGCRTVLREVQEIPLNGLGVTQADGSPGSGFVSGRPVAVNQHQQQQLADDGKLMMPAASTILSSTSTTAPTHKQQLVRTKRRIAEPESRANMINSRKVTSIVMTKECLFPDGEVQQSVGVGPKEAADKSPSLSLAPGLQVASLAIKHPANEEVVVDASVGAPLDWSARGSSSSVAKQSQPPSNLKRRSVQAPSERDFYVVSDSRRNEVAHKMYKPPSDNNPYHSLVYTSKNGADPDMEPDEPSDDSFGSPDESSPSSTAGRRGIKLSRHGSSPRLLSARERAALQDSDHDDTDPPPERPLEKDEGGGLSAREGPVEEEEAGADEAHDMKSSNQAQKLQVPQPRSFGKSLSIGHSVGRRRPQQGSLSDHLRALKPGMQGYVAETTTNQLRGNKKHSNNGPRQQQQQVASPAAESRAMSASSKNDVSPEEEDDGDDEPSARGTAQERKSQEAKADEEDSEPDLDPDYNPKENRLTLNGKPKRTQKSFAYVHRNAPKKGANKNSENDNDFVVSYGRGNVQTEHEDYDSERDSDPPPASLRNRRTPLAKPGPQKRTTAAGVALPHPQFGLRMPGLLEAAAARMQPHHQTTTATHSHRVM